MFLTIIIGIIIAVCLVSSLIIYVFMRSNENLKPLSSLSLNEKRQIKYSIRPSIDIIAKRLTNDFSIRTSISSDKSNHSSTTINLLDENQLKNPKQKSVESIHRLIKPIRSSSVVTNIFQTRHSRITNWRQGSIIDPNQIASIQFTLPSNINENKYRRRSVAICNNIIESKENPLTILNHIISTYLLSFSIVYLKNLQIKIQIHSFKSLTNNLRLQQLLIKIKLFPDGKEKSIKMKKSIENEIYFQDNETIILFSNIQQEKFIEKSLTITIHGKDQTKKNLYLGQIGKINFNQFNQFDNENPIEFMHEIEKIKPSSIELLISLEKKDEQEIIIDLRRIKGLKIDQKKLDATCFLQIIFLNNYQLLTTKQTKFFRLNSSNFLLGEQYNFNISTFNLNHLNHLMIICNLYSNSNHTNEYKSIGYIKLSSPNFCSGTGTVHWQQFKARNSFSMWHTLNKQL